MKHVDQAFPQRRSGVEVEGAAQSDDRAAAVRSCSRLSEGAVGAGYDDLRPAAGTGALSVAAPATGLAAGRMAARMAGA